MRALQHDEVIPRFVPCLPPILAVPPRMHAHCAFVRVNRLDVLAELQNLFDPAPDIVLVVLAYDDPRYGKRPVARDDIAPQHLEIAQRNSVKVSMKTDRYNEYY